MGKKQFLTYYLIAAHPGCEESDMHKLKNFTSNVLKMNPEQAQVCAIMIDNREFGTFTINYFEIDWLEEDDKLVCKDAHLAKLL